MPEIHVGRECDAVSDESHEKQRKSAFGKRRGVAVRAEYGAVILVEEHDILSEPTTGRQTSRRMSVKY